MKKDPYDNSPLPVILGYLAMKASTFCVYISICGWFAMMMDAGCWMLVMLYSSETRHLNAVDALLDARSNSRAATEQLQ